MSSIMLKLSILSVSLSTASCFGAQPENILSSLARTNLFAEEYRLPTPIMSHGKSIQSALERMEKEHNLRKKSIEDNRLSLTKHFETIEHTLKKICPSGDLNPVQKETLNTKKKGLLLLGIAFDSVSRRIEKEFRNANALRQMYIPIIDPSIDHDPSMFTNAQDTDAIRARKLDLLMQIAHAPTKEKKMMILDQALVPFFLNANRFAEPTQLAAESMAKFLNEIQQYMERVIVPLSRL